MKRFTENYSSYLAGWAGLRAMRGSLDGLGDFSFSG